MRITQQEIITNDVRVITLNEPFASLMVVGKGETRKNPTKVRGLVCIHSAQKSYPAAKVLQLCGANQYGRAIRTAGRCETNEHIIAIGRLVDCRPMVKEDEDLCFVQYIEPWREWSEKQLRWVDKRLYVYVFTDMTPIQHLKYKGSQGWTILSEDIKRMICPVFKL